MQTLSCFAAPFRRSGGKGLPRRQYDFTLQQLPPGMLATRSSTGTGFLNESVQTFPANTARFTGHIPPALLLEPQSTNLITHSASIGGTDWSSGNGVTVTQNYGVAPDGTQTSTRIVGTGTNNGRVLQVVSGLTDGDVATGSVWIKGTGTPRLQFQEDGGSWAVYWTEDVTPTSDWVRYEISATMGTDGNAKRFLISGIGGDTDIEIWGAQIEKNVEWATSYIPTTSNQATRTADEVTLNDLSWLDKDVFWFYATIIPTKAPVNGQFPPFVKFKGASDDDRIELFCSGYSNKIALRVDSGDALQVDANANMPDIVLGQTYKAAVAVQKNNFRVCVDGSTIVKDTNGSMPQSLETLQIGAADYANKKTAFLITELVIINGTPTDAEMQAMTQ